MLARTSLVVRRFTQITLTAGLTLNAILLFKEVHKDLRGEVE